MAARPAGPAATAGRADPPRRLARGPDPRQRERALARDHARGGRPRAVRRVRRGRRRAAGPAGRRDVRRGAERRRLHGGRVGDHVPAHPAGRERGARVGQGHRCPAGAAGVARGVARAVRGRVRRAAGRGVPAARVRHGAAVPPVFAVAQKVRRRDETRPCAGVLPARWRGRSPGVLPRRARDDRAGEAAPARRSWWLLVRRRRRPSCTSASSRTSARRARHIPRWPSTTWTRWRKAWRRRGIR